MRDPWVFNLDVNVMKETQRTMSRYRRRKAIYRSEREEMGIEVIYIRSK